MLVDRVSGAVLVPPHGNHRPDVQYDVVLRLILARIVHSPLEHGAVHDANVPFVAP